LTIECEGKSLECESLELEAQPDGVMLNLVSADVCRQQYLISMEFSRMGIVECGATLNGEVFRALS
jgi:hypothetical protein